jgi:hypothetical protein
MKSMAQEGGNNKEEMGEFEDLGKMLNGIIEEM